MWQEIEPIFNRAFKFSYTKKKVFFLFPILAACGVLIVLCHALWLGANPWVQASLAFIPGFVCAGVFLAAAIPLIRLYHDEVKEKPLSITATLKQSWSLIGGVASLTLPIFTAYLVLWFILGLFYLLKHIPGVGEFLGALLSFGPFLLIFGSLVLSFINLMLLFFLAPWVALKSEMRWELAEEVLKTVKAQPFIHLFFLMVGLLPILVVIGFLVLAATITGMSFVASEATWAIALQWFIIMIPFAALLSPAMLFFINFSAESFAFMQKRLKK